MYGTRESNTHTITTSLSKPVFECVRERVMTSTDLHSVGHVGEDVGSPSSVELVLVYADESTN